MQVHTLQPCYQSATAHGNENVSFANHDNLVAVYTAAGVIKIYRLHEGDNILSCKLIHTITEKTFASNSCHSFLAFGKVCGTLMLAAAGVANDLFLYHCGNNDQFSIINEVSLVGHQNPVSHGQFSSKRDELLTASAGGGLDEILIWTLDIEEAENLAEEAARKGGSNNNNKSSSSNQPSSVQQNPSSSSSPASSQPSSANAPGGQNKEGENNSNNNNNSNNKKPVALLKFKVQTRSLSEGISSSRKNFSISYFGLDEDYVLLMSGKHLFIVDPSEKSIEKQLVAKFTSPHRNAVNNHQLFSSTGNRLITCSRDQLVHMSKITQIGVNSETELPIFRLQSTHSVSVGDNSFVCLDNHLHSGKYVHNSHPWMFCVCGGDGSVSLYIKVGKVEGEGIEEGGSSSSYSGGGGGGGDESSNTAGTSEGEHHHHHHHHSHGHHHHHHQKNSTSGSSNHDNSRLEDLVPMRDQNCSLCCRNLLDDDETFMLAAMGKKSGSSSGGGMGPSTSSSSSSSSSSTAMGVSSSTSITISPSSVAAGGGVTGGEKQQQQNSPYRKVAILSGYSAWHIDVASFSHAALAACTPTPFSKYIFSICKGNLYIHPNPTRDSLWYSRKNVMLIAHRTSLSSSSSSSSSSKQEHQEPSRMGKMFKKETRVMMMVALLFMPVYVHVHD